MIKELLEGKKVMDLLNEAKKDITKMGFEELFGYTIEIYPNKVSIVTDAPPEEMKKIYDDHMNGGDNIENLLRNGGFVYVIGDYQKSFSWKKK